jgi:hypothetical protein
MLVAMTYLTYGPAPTSHYRIAGAPGEPLLATPLDRERRGFGRQVRFLSRTAMRVTSVAGIVLIVGAAAMVLRIAIYYALGRHSGLF